MDKKGYQENSRETFRDETLKRWVSATIIESKAGLAANGELPLPCGTEVPMEVASDSRNNYSSLTRGFWLFVPIMAYSLMPLSL